MKSRKKNKLLLAKIDSSAAEIGHSIAIKKDALSNFAILSGPQPEELDTLPLPPPPPFYRNHLIFLSFSSPPPTKHTFPSDDYDDKPCELDINNYLSI
jgi:hypothetical protein